MSKTYSTKFKEKTYSKYNNEYVHILKRYEKEYDPRIGFISKLSFSNKKILDVGCGTGKISSMFLNDNKVYGVDISSKILNIAKKRGIITRQINLDKQKMPFNNRNFDIIFLFDTLEHVFLPEKLLKDCYRLLKTNGELYLTTHNVADSENLANEYDLSLFEVRKLIQLLQKIGFKKIVIHGWSWNEPKNKTLIEKFMSLWLWYNPQIAKDVYIIARK